MKNILALCITLILTGCGFHLRGLQDIPTWLSPVYLSNQGVSRDIPRTLHQILKGYQVQITQAPTPHGYEIILLDDTLLREINSVAASTAPRQYQLIYTLHYQVKSPKHLEPIQTVLVTRQITMNNDRILGSNYEEALTVSEMHQEACQKILMQINGGKHPKHFQ